jgi:hypothetical protein
LAPTSPTDAEQLGTRLHTLIDEARCRDSKSYLEWRDRALADRAFSHIAEAIERGLRTIDPRSTDAAVLQRLHDTVRRR